MKPGPWQWLKTFPGLFVAPRTEPLWQAERIVSVQRRIVLPVKVGVIAVALYFAFSFDWLSGPANTQTVIFGTLRSFFLVYVFCNVVAGVVFFLWKRFPPGLFQWLVFVLGLLDGLFAAGLMLMPYSGGWQSVAFWLFPVLIVLNAASIPLAVPQIVLNLLLSVFYIGAGILYVNIGEGEITLMYVPGLSPPHASAETNAATAQAHSSSLEKPHKPIYWDSSMPHSSDEETPTESFLLRLFVLLLLTLCCYGVQALAERQRREVEEAREFAMREGQLHSAGRLAAEFAHQIKNPLAVITNAAYSLQRSLRENKNSAEQQLEIIQEEVVRADRVITQIMGYAQLSEGRVEKLDVIEEIEQAIAQVFPPAVPTEIKIRCQFEDYFPPLLMQRVHLSEIFVNLLKNAREAIGQSGNIFVVAGWRPETPIEVSIRDEGSGIPADKITRIFEAYYTTKNGGTGLGLAIVKHNTELYGGSIRVKSEVGKGSEFILTFPPKAVVNIRK
jgi:signal transduction histidine kinase